MADEDKAAAIRFISNIVEKISQQENITKIVGGIQQILDLWRYIPNDLKRKAYFVFEKVWKKKAIAFSTKHELLPIFFDNEFQDKQVKKIYQSISDNDASALLLGLSTLELINRGQHTQAELLKQSAYSRYEKRGSTIVNFVTTKDIYLMIDEDTHNIENKEEIKRKFEWWVDNYQTISVLVSPEDLQNAEKIENQILSATCSLKRNYVLINMSTNSIDSINTLINIIEKMENNKKIKYLKFEKENISESGFYYSFKGRLLFR